MASSKAHHFPQHLYDQAFWHKNLSHPARKIILLYLLKNGPTAFYIIRRLIPELAKTTVSQHFSFLKKSHLIFSKDVYPTTIYRLNAKFCHILAGKIEEYNIQFKIPPEQPPVKKP